MDLINQIMGMLYNDKGANYNNSSMSNQGYSVPGQYAGGDGIPALDLVSTPQGSTHQAFGGAQILGEGGMMDYGLQGLQTIMGIVNSTKANKLAKNQFNMQKEFANANLNNTISSFNTRLGDKARARGHVEGQSQSQVDDYINKNKLSR